MGVTYQISKNIIEVYLNFMRRLESQNIEMNLEIGPNELLSSKYPWELKRNNALVSDFEGEHDLVLQDG